MAQLSSVLQCLRNRRFSGIDGPRAPESSARGDTVWMWILGASPFGAHELRARSSPPVRDFPKNDPVSDREQTDPLEALQALKIGNASEYSSTFSWHQGLSQRGRPASLLPKTRASSRREKACAMTGTRGTQPAARLKTLRRRATRVPWIPPAPQH